MPRLCWPVGVNDTLDGNNTLLASMASKGPSDDCAENPTSIATSRRDCVAADNRNSMADDTEVASKIEGIITFIEIVRQHNVVTSCFHATISSKLDFAPSLEELKQYTA